MEIVDFILNIDVHLGNMITSYGSLTYGILFLIIFAETGLVFAPFLPGDSLLFAAGMFSAIGSLNILILSGLLWIAAVAGDTLNYWIGYHFGNKIAKNRYIPINENHITKTQEFYEKHGGMTIILARFMPIVRTFAPFVAGIGKMEYKKFILYNIIGATLWVFGFLLAGYFFGNIPIIKDNFSVVILAIIFVSISPAIFKVVKSKMRINSTEEII